MTAIFLKILDMSIAAMPILWIVSMLNWPLRLPKEIRGILWALVAVRMIFPFSIVSSLSVVPERLVDGTIVEELAASYADPFQYVYEDDERYEAALESGAIPGADEDGRSYVVVEYKKLTAPKTFREARAPLFAALWLAGMAILLLYGAFSFLRLRRKTAAAAPLRDGLYLCDGIASPFILGVFRPRIFLPSDIGEGQIPAVEAHERAHLKRGDHVWKVLGFLLLAVYWFSPFQWLMYKFFCFDIELACDERVVRDMSAGERKGYAETLLALSLPERGAVFAPLAFGETGVKERIKAVARYKKPAAWVVIVAAVLAVAAAVCFFTAPKNRTFSPNEVYLGSMLSSYAVMGNVTDQETVDYLYTLWKNAEVEGESEKIGRGVDLYVTFRDTKTGATERFIIFPDGVASWNDDFPEKYYLLKDGRELYQTFMQYRLALIEAQQESEAPLS